MTKKYDIKPEQAQVLRKLEIFIGKSIPHENEITGTVFGVKIEDDNVVGLGLFKQELSKLPLSIKKLTALTHLSLNRNKLLTLPKSIGNLTALTYLNLNNNKLKTLPQSIGNLSSLQILSLDYNQLTTLPETIGNLSSLQKFDLMQNQLQTLPDSIGDLKSLETLNIWFNKLLTLPESITKLTSLQALNLHNNRLSALPDSITKLTSLTSLLLGMNKLTNLPESFWRLKALTRLDLSGNSWEDEWKGIEKDTIPRVLELCRQKASIIVFISYSKGDNKHYHVKKLKKTLNKQEEIREVHGSREYDVLGSQLFLFIATNNSMNNDQCREELKSAISHEIPIIPIKGLDVEWEELNQIDVGEDFNLSEKLGLSFDGKNVENFCDELYEHIKKFKREVNLFEPEERTLDKQWLNVKTISEKFIESEEFREKYSENINQFNKLSEDLKTKQISLEEYIINWSRILKPKSK